jgi:hypothetical protein
MRGDGKHVIDASARRSMDHTLGAPFFISAKRSAFEGGLWRYLEATGSAHHDALDLTLREYDRLASQSESYGWPAYEEAVEALNRSFS